MPLVTSKEMFAKAYDGGYAIGAFNVNNMEIVQGITEACREEKAPVILLSLIHILCRGRGPCHHRHDRHRQAFSGAGQQR